MSLLKNRLKTKFNFIVDPKLIQDERSMLLIRALQEEKIKYNIDLKEQNDFNLSIIFSHKSSLKSFSKFKNKILVIDSNESQDTSVVEKINFNSLEEITSFLDKIFLIEKRLMLESKMRDSERLFNKMKEVNIEKCEKVAFDLNSDQQKELEAILELEINLLKDDNITIWNNHFKVFSRKHYQLHSMQLYTGSELLSEEISIDESTLIFNLQYNDLFLVLKYKHSCSLELSIGCENLINMILRLIQVTDQNLIRSDGEIDFWKKIFSKIPYPMSVISNLGDLLIYNESFAKIGILPKECLRYKDQESLEILQQFYKVRRIEFPIGTTIVSYFVFYTSDGHDQKSQTQNSRKGGVDELGIISSSIAHELNNPLAGILAALSLLSLEDNWSNEALSDLDDMKNGAKRCKELVEIFLGFSRFSPKSINSPSVVSSLDQAINLLRFRMIESNLRLDIKYTPTLEVFSKSINTSIMSMIFYLLLSELMTAFAHERLITQTHLSVMTGEVLELTNQIVLKLDYDFEYEEKIAQSKLIQHLLVFEKLEINFLRKEIRLIYRS